MGQGRAYRAMSGKTFLLTTRVKTPGAIGRARCLAPTGAPQKLQVPPPSPGTSWAALGCPSTGSRGCGRAPGTGAVENARAEANRELSSAPQHGSAQCCEPKSGIQCTYFVHNICIIHPVYIQGIYSHGDCIYFIHMRVYLSAFRGSEYFRHFFFPVAARLVFPAREPSLLFRKEAILFLETFLPKAQGSGAGTAGPLRCRLLRLGRNGAARGGGAGRGALSPSLVPWVLSPQQVPLFPGDVPRCRAWPGVGSGGVRRQVGMGWGGMRT